MDIKEIHDNVMDALDKSNPDCFLTLIVHNGELMIGHPPNIAEYKILLCTLTALQETMSELKLAKLTSAGITKRKGV